MPDPAFFHAESDSVRFWVAVGDHDVGATISRSTLHYRFNPNASGEDPLVTFEQNRGSLAAVVTRRVGEGALEPVMLREYDLR